MADMDKFLLDNVPILVADTTARSTASAASAAAAAAAAQAAQNTQDIADIKALGRVSITYDSTNTALVITTTTHQ